ncbi:proteasome subunit beta [Halobacteriales archaeon QH_6_68_27]|nr:MAG: proteasome subunit beta [Halobacteriales archaeon QH_6_68_27]
MTRQDRGPDGGHDGIAPRSQLAGGKLGRAWTGEGHDTGPIDRQDQTGSAAPRFDTGTTVVGLAIDEAVVMAADRRMSLGGRFTANKSVRKVEQVHPTAAMGISGSVGPAQDLIRSLRAEASLYESRRGEAMSLDAALSIPASPVSEGEYAGVNPENFVNWLVLADDYAATGSGMQVAYGVLERRYDRGASVEAAREAAVAAVAAASERDTASGNGVTVTTVTGEGVETVAREEAAAGEVV